MMPMAEADHIAQGKAIAASDVVATLALQEGSRHRDVLFPVEERPHGLDGIGRPFFHNPMTCAGDHYAADVGGGEPGDGRHRRGKGFFAADRQYGHG